MSNRLRHFEYPERGRDPLDDLLAAARWPEPTPESTDRLCRSWTAAWQNNRWTAWVWRAAAAVLIIGMGATWLAVQNRDPDKPRLVLQPSPEPSAAIPAMSPIGRPPTLMERAATITFAKRQSGAKPLPIAEIQARVDEALGKLVADPSSDPHAAAAPLRIAGKAELIARYLAEAAECDGANRRRAGVLLLGEVGTDREVPVLLGALQEPALHAAAISSLVKLANAPMLAELARQEAQSSLQRQILAALLGRGTAQATELYLQFVRNPETTMAAIEATDHVSGPAIDRLLEQLNSPQYATRLAAARVLGHIDGPALTQRLATMAERNINRREVLLALLYSPNQQAEQYLATAASRPDMAAVIRSVKVQLQNLQQEEQL